MKFKRFISWVLTVSLCLLMVAGPAASAYAGALTAVTPSIIVAGTGVTAPASYTVDQLKALAGSDVDKTYVFSSNNDNNFTHEYVANGVLLSKVLGASGASLSDALTFTSGDGFSVPFSAGDAMSITRYYYPNAAQQDSSGAVEVPPIIAWAASDTQTGPVALAPTDMLSMPRPLFGQKSVMDNNQSYFPKNVGGPTVITSGAANTSTVLTVNGVAYSALDLLMKPAVMGTFGTRIVEGVALSTLLAEVPGDDTVTFTTTDSSYDMSGYSMTVDQLSAANAVLAYAQDTGNGLTPISGNYTLYLDGMTQAKYINTITTETPAPEPEPKPTTVLTITVDGTDTKYSLADLQAMNATTGSYTYSTKSGETTVFAQGVFLSDLLAGVADNATVAVTCADGYGAVTSQLPTTKAGLTALDALVAYQSGADASSLAPITDAAYGDLPSLYVDGSQPAKLASQIVVTSPAPAQTVLTVTVDGTPTHYTLTALQALKATIGSYSYTTQTGSKTVSAKGVLLADLLAGVSDGATVAVTCADGYGAVTSQLPTTKADLTALDALVAYQSGADASSLAPITDATYGDLPSLYVDGFQPAKLASQIVVTSPAPAEQVTISVSPTTLSLKADETASLQVVVTPAEAAAEGAGWSSSDPTVATVDSEGLVTAVAPGTATITVKSLADQTMTATVAITVTEQSGGGSDTSPVSAVITAIQSLPSTISN